MKYTKHFNTKVTPQSQPIPGSNQIPNNASGYAFPISSKKLLERFLLIGTEGGTYYVTEKKLTVDNTTTIVNMIKYDGENVLSTLLEFNETKRAPKENPSIFVLALLCTFAEPKVKVKSYSYIKSICKTSTHLFKFCQYIQDLRGWSRGLRTGISNWYLDRNDDSLAYQLVKYRQRDGWTHRDVLRLAHPKPVTVGQNNLFKWTIGKENEQEFTPHQLTIGYTLASKETDPEILAKYITSYNLTWEMIPTPMLNKKEVLEALLPNMPGMALLRNLNRMTIAGLFDLRTSDTTKIVVSKLIDKNFLMKSRLHPITILNTLKVYSSGNSVLGKLSWTPQPSIVRALEQAFEISLSIPDESTDKKILIAVDVSGSMGYTNVRNFNLTPREIGAALLLQQMKTNSNVEVVYFNSTVIVPQVHGNDTYNTVLESTNTGGSTDCSAPYLYALKKKLNVDAIITYTDNETWLGYQHPLQAFIEYRETINPNVKGIVVGMVANNCNLFPEEMENTLNITGYDSSIPQLINEFIRS